MKRYTLSEGTVNRLKHVLNGRMFTRSPGNTSGLAVPSEWPHPYEVQWAQSLNSGNGSWIIWLPPGHLFVDGQEIDVTAPTTQGGTDGMTAAGSDYPTGWYVLDITPASSGDTTLYLDVGASRPTFGTSSTSMTTPVRIATINKAQDGSNSIKHIVTSALVFAAGDALHPYKVKWFPDNSSAGGELGIYIPSGSLMVGDYYISTSGLTPKTNAGADWYVVPSVASGYLYLNVKAWYYYIPMQSAADNYTDALDFRREANITASMELSDTRLDPTTYTAHNAIYSIGIATVATSQNGPPVIGQKVKSSIILPGPIPEPVRGSPPPAVSGNGGVIDSLLLERHADGKVYMSSTVAIMGGNDISVTKVSDDAIAGELGVPYFQISYTGSGGGGGGGGGGGSTETILVPGSGIVIEKNGTAVQTTSGGGTFTIKAVYV